MTAVRMEDAEGCDQDQVVLVLSLSVHSRQTFGFPRTCGVTLVRSFLPTSVISLTSDAQVHLATTSPSFVFHPSLNPYIHPNRNHRSEWL